MALHLSETYRWGGAISLTSIQDPAEAIERHILESLMVAGRVAPTAGRIVDVGSGAGYPGLVVAAALEGREIVLLEPSLRKSVFLERMAARMDASNVVVRRQRIDRAEDLESLAPIGAVTMRAVAAVDAVVRGAPKALVDGGRVVLLCGAKAAESIPAGGVEGLATVERTILPGKASSTILVLQRTARI